ncbi:hypothetical protein HaLaN_28261, partial [Haematococcus lacustris]
MLSSQTLPPANYILVASYFVMFWIMLFGRKCLGKAELAAAPA